MHSPEPREGKCNAKYKDGSGYCAKRSYNRDPAATNKRCEFHGGLSTGARTPEGRAKPRNNSRHNLYSQALRNSIPEEDKAMWDQIPTDTDLTNEIQLARYRVKMYQDWIGKGIDKVEGYRNRVTGEMNYHSTHELLQKAIDQARLLAESQQRMHPEAGTKGDMTITVSLAGGGAIPKDEDVEDLDADGTAHDEAPPTVPQDKAPADEPEGALDELGEDP